MQRPLPAKNVNRPAKSTDRTRKFAKRLFARPGSRILLICIIFIIGCVLWVLSAENVIGSAWSVALAVCFSATGVFLACIQYFFPPSPSLDEDRLYEVYRKQILSMTIKPAGIVVVRTKRLLGESISAVSLSSKDLNGLYQAMKNDSLDTNSFVEEPISEYADYITFLTLNSREEVITQPVYEVEIEGEPLEVAIFQGLSPGMYLCWISRISSIRVEGHKSRYAFVEVFPGLTTEIDWRIDLQS